jgi:glycerophosphoryl diester phosphodiesterase
MRLAAGLPRLIGGAQLMLIIGITLQAQAESRCLPSAHRGERSHSFDNSVEAIRAASGLPFIEIDIRLTADNDLVLFHDRRLSVKNFVGPTSLMGRPIATLTREDIFSGRFPDGSKIPKFRAALHEVERSGSMLMLDVKSNSPRDFKRVMEEVSAVGAESRVVVQCQTKEVLDFMRRHYPRVAVLARAHSETDVELLLESAPSYVQVNDTWNLSSVVPKIHTGGARVVVKTLSPETDRPETWRSLCSQGVDIVLTDRPREFLSLER